MNSVLAGPTRSDAETVRWPDWLMDERDREFWGRTLALLPAKMRADPEAELGAGRGTSAAVR